MKRFFIATIAMLLMLFFSCNAIASTIYFSDDWVLEKPDDDPWEIDTYVGSDENVTVPTQFGVINLYILGNHAFSNNDTVKSVTVSAPINTIGDYAFLNASALTSIKLSESIVLIGEGVFSSTTALRSINLEDTSISLVPVYAFLNSGFEEVALPETCVMIANNAFAQCSNLQKVIIPDSVNEIGEEAFRSSESVVIYAPYGSYAIEYAIAKGIDYVITDPDYYEVEILLGDADGDNDVSILDATRIQRWLASYNDGNEEQVLLCGDTDRDGDVSILDATLIQRWLAQFTVPTPIGEVITIQVPVSE